MGAGVPISEPTQTYISRTNSQIWKLIQKIGDQMVKCSFAVLTTDCMHRNARQCNSIDTLAVLPYLSAGSESTLLKAEISALGRRKPCPCRTGKMQRDPKTVVIIEEKQ